MKLLFLALAFLATPAHATTDPYNTLQWRAGDTGDWYEWWYYKVVDPSSNEAFFFTYGVTNPGKQSGQAFLQVGRFGDDALTVEHFPIFQFRASREQTSVHIGASEASDTRLKGSADGGRISWDLSVEKNWAFDAMGWVMKQPGLSNIYWYPAQASASMTGTITFRGRTYQLQNAPAYQDRNWGRSFPEWWTWLVSNEFKNAPGAALAAGGGKPRVFGGPALFDGLCIGLRYGGKEYAFRTPDGDSVTFDIRWGKWEVTAENKHGERIEISAFAPKEKFQLLPFDVPSGGTFYDYEALQGSMTVKLMTREGSKWKPVATLETDEAGIEWGTPKPLGLEELFHAERQLAF